MTRLLKLSGNELVLFAILWRESEQGRQNVKLNYTQFSEDMGVTVPTFYNCIKKLAERGYIVEQSQGIYSIDEICMRR